MVVVWSVFIGTAVVLAVLALIGLRWRGSRAAVYHLVGRFLLALSLITALFPIGLRSLGAASWVGIYIGIVVLITILVTWRAVVAARRVKV